MKRYPLIGKCLAVGIIFFLVGTSAIPATAQDIKKTSQSTSSGNWLYVGGSGPGNYSYIQDALDNATDDDTIFVYSGSYYEDIIIEKKVFLQGQDKNTTIIQGAGDENDTVTICSDAVRLSSLTLKNDRPYGIYSSIVFAQTNYSYIIDNSFVGDDTEGALFSSIYMIGSKNNVISGNTFSKGMIRLHFGCNYNQISYNILDSSVCGIFLFYSYNNVLTHNLIEGTGLEAIAIIFSSDNKISYNNIRNCKYGISLDSDDCEITYNNFISVKIKAEIYSKNNIWDHNYWGRSRVLPKLIIGFDFVTPHRPDPPYLEFYLSIDWHPARSPNEI